MACPALIAGLSASGVKTTQTRALKKINTRITRTKRHFPAHGGTLPQ
jgi:hypothetical protein